ncbi:metallophosphoesterase [Falsiroseomonas oryzae]|uniref:metallophosphoesterase n=1 Tax=Falsiroseomonas oryzae TaxID=2766473 RepID=UPI0022EA62C8|nr:metallophosphoesterase [Roseomonas sp. MO-31]
MLAESLAPGWLPEGLRVYAIGDVHGCADRLAGLHARIAAHAAARPIGRVLLVHLGDYVDRGADSAGVLALLRGPPPVPGAAVVNLVGNHEQMMLAALDPRADAQVVEFWLDNGGAATLESYGADATDLDSWAQVPEGDLDFLRRLRPSQSLGGYFFAHAGVRPDVPLDRQDVMDLAWIREPFLSWRGSLAAVVVHGHTPADGPEVLPHRIGVDTGAVFGGPLTCAVLEGERVGFLFA